MIKRKKHVGHKQNIGKENKYFRAVCFIVIVVVLGILVGTISYTIYRVNTYQDIDKKIISYQKIPASVEVIAGRYGLNVDKDALKFGIVPPGGGVTRFLNITTKEKAKLELYIDGPIAKFISSESNNKILEANGSYSIPIQLDVPNGTISGQYNGTLYVTLLRQ